MSVVLNSDSFFGSLDRSVKEFDKKFAIKIQRMMTEGMRRLLRKTPVNTGAAVMNYVATVGRPYSGPQKQGFAPVEATNKLPLGAEKLRPDAEAVARATLQGIDYSDPYKAFYITNRADNIVGLEYGQLPGKPYTPRSPQGMFGVTVQELLAMLNTGRL